MKSKSRLKQTSEMKTGTPVLNVIKLLLKDHRAMRVLIKKIKSHRAKAPQIKVHFRLLEKLVRSHVAAEEFALLSRIDHHPKFEDHAKESTEEHRIHDHVLLGIARLQDADRKITQMKIFCELLEDHIDEEEEDLFPSFKKYSALKTRKKMGALFLKRRRDTHRAGEKLGSLKK